MPTTISLFLETSFGQLRLKKKWSQEKLAENQGFIRHTSVVLSAANEKPRDENVVKLARALKVDGATVQGRPLKFPPDCRALAVARDISGPCAKSRFRSVAFILARSRLNF